MEISICILTHNQPVLLRQCVEACLSEISASAVRAEIIIVDNASHQGYPQGLAAVSPMIRVIRNEQNLGFSAANNAAIRISRGEYVLILNDDAILQSGALEAMVVALRTDPGVGAVGPKLLNPDGSIQQCAMNRRLPNLRGVACELLGLDGRLRRYGWTRDWLTLWRVPEETAEREQVGGACLLIRRDALDNVGLFDEGFHYEFEDTELCYRLRKAGWRILSVRSARVIHHGSATFLNSWSELEFTNAYFKSANYFFKKHSSPAKYFLVRITLGFVVLARLSKRGLMKILRRRATVGDIVRSVPARLALLRSVLGLEPPNGAQSRSAKG